MDSGIGTNEVICLASNYNDIFGESFPKGVNSTVYDVIDETFGG